MPSRKTAAKNILKDTGDLIFGAEAGAAEAAGTVGAGAGLAEDIVSSIPDNVFEKQTDKAFKALRKSARVASKKGASGVAKKAFSQEVRNFVEFLTGKPVPGGANFGTRFQKIKSLTLTAARQGRSAAEIGMLTGGALREAGVVSAEIDSKLTRIGQRFSKATAATAKAAKGAEAGFIRRAAGSSLVRGAAPFAALIGLGGFLKSRRKGKQEREEILEILDQESKFTPRAFGPLQTVELLRSLGPGVFQRMQEDPALALAIQQRLQSEATAGLPRGASVLQLSGGGSAPDVQAILDQIGREE